jgi:hypothetical protein
LSARFPGLVHPKPHTEHEGDIRLTSRNFRLTRTLLAALIGHRDRLSWYLQAIAAGLPCTWWHFSWASNFTTNSLHSGRPWRRRQVLPSIRFDDSLGRTCGKSYSTVPGKAASIRLERVPHLLDRLQRTSNVHAAIAVWAMVAKADLWGARQCSTGLFIIEGNFERH